MYLYLSAAFKSVSVNLTALEGTHQVPSPDRIPARELSGKTL